MSEIIKNYLNSIKDMSEKDKEHTHRSALQILLNEIKDATGNGAIKIVHEPNNDKEGRGAPDFRFEINSLIVGYIENKRVNANLEEVIKSEQIKKYLELSDNIIITDYLRFIRIDKNGNITSEVRLCELSELKNGRKPKKLNLEEKANKLFEIFKLFLSHKPKPINSAKEFANALAERTKLLKNSLLEMENNERVKALYDTFKNTIYSKIDYADFCDNFAQTLTYSLFLAKLNADGEKINLYNLTEYIPKSFPLIRAMSNFLKNLKEGNDEKLKTIDWLLIEIVNINNNIDEKLIIEELNKFSLDKNLKLIMNKDPYMHFYETFLSYYNPELREKRGVYYTPQSVVNFIINSIDLVLKKDFNKYKGFGEALNQGDSITLLDFAAGTGTFLLDSFRKALSYYDKNSAKYKPKELINKFYGFEFMIAPYTIAHLKLSQTLKEEFDYNLSDDERLNIFLTNTLETINIEEEKGKFSILVDLIKETELAQETKDKNILIITGNPPYSGASANKGIFEEEIRSEYKDSLEKEPLAIVRNGKIEKEKNPKWLLDDYVKFIRFAEMKLNKQTEGGIFGFISNNSFLDNPTFRGMRHSLLKSFDKIYILDLHGNVRKKEISPDGSKDENVFDIMQGVSINIFIKNSNSSLRGSETAEAINQDILAKVYHYDLFGKREDKYKFLFDNSLNNIEWKELKLESPFFLFVPQDENKKAEYDKGYSVKDMFRISSTGICSQRDSVVIHKTKESVKEMIKDFCNLSKEENIKKYKIEKDGRDWQIQLAIDSVKKSELNKNGVIIQINYRPFDFYWTYYNEETKGFMAYPRTEVMQHFLPSLRERSRSNPNKIDCHASKEARNDNNIGLVINRSVALDKYQHAFITNKITDLHIMETSNASAYVLPLYIYDTANVRKILREENEEVGGMFEDIKHFEKSERIENFTPKFREFINEKYGYIKPEKILGYIYAVLFHKEYRKKYFDFLKIDFPKIPFVKSKEDFFKFAKLGEELYNLHLGNLKIQNEVGEPMFKDKQNKNEKIVKAIYNEKDKNLFVNESLYFKNVDKEVWEYKIGGYQVLDKYLKSHKNENIDYEHFENVIKILARSIEIEAEISKLGLSM
ncbi:type ISP restriction/modification enzyme [Brachyspira catarrhinii]|uniref:site-specific DNA-methyltransferase (adenine-specific) n=1 Tax=Brachyspira catarrhinii TaxID=2528966 RepID=A0ABY2TU79_9SPIR|nr:type ISP restriction/modification enzyme [Brachyspira catarrhinii]TKZ36285.1 DNA methyltransferase [Brachyspira catarrhinii]